MTRCLYLDTGVLVALLDEQDDFSSQAREIMLSEGWKVTSSLAVSEVVSLLSLRRARILQRALAMHEMTQLFGETADLLRSIDVGIESAGRDIDFTEMVAKVDVRMIEAPMLPVRFRKCHHWKSAGVLDLMHLELAHSLKADVLVTTDKSLAAAVTGMGSRLLQSPDRSEGSSCIRDQVFFSSKCSETMAIGSSRGTTVEAERVEAF